MGGDLLVTGSAPSGTVPELGPLLGRLLGPHDGSPREISLDDLRVELLTTMFDAAGRARGAARRDGEAAARAALAHQVWLTAFRRAADLAAGRCLTETERRLAAAARRSRMPARLLARCRPTPEDRRVIHHRFESAGIPLERTPPPEDEAVWADGLRRAAAALEASWDRLARFASEELAAAEPQVAAVREWRRPRAPLWVLSGGVLLLALAVGLVLGGYLPAPGLLADLRRWWWGLPWP